MTISELSALASREAVRQEIIARKVSEAGGVWDAILGRWVAWRDGRPMDGANHEHATHS